MKRLNFFIFLALMSLQTFAQANKPIIDKILILKDQNRMYLLSRGKVIKSYLVALGRNRKGTKIKEGDKRTPEGIYSVSAKNPKSKYHKALRVSYPRPEDIERASKRGVKPGGDIMIHGLPKSCRHLDRSVLPRMSTRGCVAVTNKDIDEIWGLVPVGTAIDIRP